MTTLSSPRLKAEASRRQESVNLKRLDLTRPQFVQLDKRVNIYAQPLADRGNAFTMRRVYPAPLGACGYALTNVGMLNNGQVTICCADYEGRTSLCSLYSHSLAELLASEQAQAIRAGKAQR